MGICGCCGCLDAQISMHPITEHQYHGRKLGRVNAETIHFLPQSLRKEWPKWSDDKLRILMSTTVQSGSLHVVTISDPLTP